MVIRPEVGDLHWSSFSEAINLINEGEKAAQEKRVDIRHLLPGIKKFIRLRGKPRPRKPEAMR